jgi:hypothetical protein
MADALWNILKLVSVMGLGIFLLVATVYLFVRTLLAMED